MQFQFFNDGMPQQDSHFQEMYEECKAHPACEGCPLAKVPFIGEPNNQFYCEKGRRIQNEKSQKT